MCPRWRRGAVRKRSSLNSPIVLGRSRPPGQRPGTVALNRCRPVPGGSPRAPAVVAHARLAVLGPGDDPRPARGPSRSSHATRCGPPDARQVGERLVEIGGPVGIDADQRAADPPERETSPDDYAGEPHPADRGLEQPIRGSWLQLERFAVGCEQADRLHVAAERSRRAVVLAVDVAGDGAADAHVLGSRHDRHDPAVRHHLVEQLTERDARLRGHDAMLGVKLGVLELAELDHEPPRELSGIPVTAAHAPRNCPDARVALPGDDRRAQLLEPPRTQQADRDRRATTPAGDRRRARLWRPWRPVAAPACQPAAWTPSANSTSHANPAICSRRSASSRSSGASPSPARTRAP